MKKIILAIVISVIVLSHPATAESPRSFDLGMNALLEGNFAEAYCQWKPLAQRGHAEAQYNLGWLYANGNGLHVDMSQALHWWNAAAIQGHADAEFALGLAYTLGEGVKKDLNAAAGWFLMAAQRGHAEARESLTRLAGDARFDILSALPGLASEPWFGWMGEVTGDRVNVRAGPGTNQKIVAKLDRGQAIRVLGRKGNWLRIQLPASPESQAGDEGTLQLAWIYHSLLKPVGPQAAML